MRVDEGTVELLLMCKVEGSKVCGGDGGVGWMGVGGEMGVGEGQVQAQEQVH